MNQHLAGSFTKLKHYKLNISTVFVWQAIVLHCFSLQGRCLWYCSPVSAYVACLHKSSIQVSCTPKCPGRAQFQQPMRILIYPRLSAQVSFSTNHSQSLSGYICVGVCVRGREITGGEKRY